MWCFLWFLSDPSLLEQTYISPELRQVSSIPFLVVFLSSVRLLLNVERVGFVFRKGNASLFANLFFKTRKKCLRASTIPTRRWVILTNFSVVARMSTKKGGGWQGIYSSNIEGFVNETFQKALKKKSNQIVVVYFIPKLLF